MRITALSPCVVTDKLTQSRDFFVRHFKAQVVFDNGWYVTLRLGDPACELNFMAPRDEDHPQFAGQGVTYNLAVENVDDVYKKLTHDGLVPVMPLDNHPWGDRGFAVQDFNGIVLYVYTPTEPDDEFKPFFKA